VQAWNEVLSVPAMARSSRDVVRAVVSRLQLAESPSQLSWLHVNDSRADEPNLDQETPPEQMDFLNTELEKCLARVLPFFQRKAKAMAEVDPDQKEASGPRLELLLHPPVYTCEQAARMCPKPIMNGGETLAMKNLFLRDKKKRFFLVSACVDTEIKLKEVKFAKQVGFASEAALKEKLNLVAGSVTPFGLLNDGTSGKGEVGEGSNTDQQAPSVEFHLDPRVVAAPDTTVVDFHPNACHATICMNARDFVEFIEKEAGHQVNVLNLE
jgi:Ala-tRNA(Pro) deacylase